MLNLIPDTIFIWATERLIEEDFRSGPLNARDIVAWYMREGSVVIDNGSEILTGRTGQWIFPGEGHPWLEFSRDAVVLSLRFRISFSQGFTPFPVPGTIVVSGSQEAVLLECAEALKKHHQRDYTAFLQREQPGRTEFSQLEMMSFYEHGRPIPFSGSLIEWYDFQAVLHLWVAAYLHYMEEAFGPLKRSDMMDPRLDRAVQFMQRTAADRRPSLEEIARASGLSQAHLARLFRQDLGTTPRRYLEKLRFAHACRELAANRYSCKEIAASLGFPSDTAFSSWFSRLAGKPPRRYRKLVEV
jgi:AraC-like DNA-binding protein